MVVGNRLGVCPTCTLVVVTTQQPTREVGDWFNYPNEKIIAQLIDVQDDVKNKNRQGKATINMSFNCGGELCKGYYCDLHPEIPHPPDYYDPKDPKNPHGQPPAPPKPTSTTTGSPPTKTPEPPEGTFPLDLCVGSTVTPSGQHPVYSYSAYGAGAHCYGVFIVDGNIGSSPTSATRPITTSPSINAAPT
ncbi:hypothetical protein N7471_000256 [Penicillium samsonianum]|uniref:uncharacterized protein n=1 Tax=Penicillium samsonianum TaxID=1882272 RepID=UPI002546FCBB|nr:uncharacterized protein N7471_000256 [Penicillium samsonianum]KAJ6149057.1 hypothetical protein N7471_000256 [Penicillium samsonianum]